MLLPNTKNTHRNGMLQLVLIVGWMTYLSTSFTVSSIRIDPSKASGCSRGLFLFRSDRLVDPRASVDPNIVSVESHADWSELFLDEEDGDKEQMQLTAVTFTASWCKFCQKFKQMWSRKCARKYSDRVKFASVDYPTNKKLCKSMGIRKLPTIRLYYTGDLLTSFPCGPKSFKLAQERLVSYVDMTPVELEQAVVKHYKIEQQQMSQSINDNSPIEEYESESPALEEDAPSLFLRKRDRLKQKLGYNRQTSLAAGE